MTIYNKTKILLCSTTKNYYFIHLDVGIYAEKIKIQIYSNI